MAYIETVSVQDQSTRPWMDRFLTMIMVAGGVATVAWIAAILASMLMPDAWLVPRRSPPGWWSKPSCTIRLPGFRRRGWVIPRFPRLVPVIPSGFRDAAPPRPRGGPHRAPPDLCRVWPPAPAPSALWAACARPCGPPGAEPVAHPRPGLWAKRRRPVEIRWTGRRRVRYGSGLRVRRPRRVRCAGATRNRPDSEGLAAAPRRIRCAATPNPMREPPESPQNPMRIHAESDADPRRTVCATTRQAVVRSKEFAPPYNPHNWLSENP